MNKGLEIPKGFSIEILGKGSKEITFNLCHLDKSIGYTCLTRRKQKGIYVTHSSLDKKYHNKGLGVLMYVYALSYGLKKGWSVASSGYSSDNAIRLWKSKRLRQYFKIKCKRGSKDCFDKFYVYRK